MLVKTVSLYEYLIRWNEAGAISGYHIKTLTKIIDDENGNVESVKDSGALTPAQADAAGFPLSAILDQIAADSILEREAALSEKAQAIAERDAAISEKEKAEAERDAALAEKQQLETVVSNVSTDNT